MFSEFIRSSGLNRAAWADRLGISRPYLSDLLNGNKTPSLQLAFKIEQATGGKVPASAWLADAATDAATDATPAEDAA